MMSIQMSIEKTRESDLDDIFELLDLVKLSAEGVSKYLDHFIVVKDNRKIVGCIGLEVYEKIGLLRSLAIHPEYQKSGLGTELTKKLLTRAKDLGIHELYLLTSTARNFFEKFGFTEIAKDSVGSVIKRSPGFSYSCETAMRKELDPVVRVINGYKITDITVL
jgi:amino-acid N-acetyltransferase